MQHRRGRLGGLIDDLAAKGVRCGDVTEVPWGNATTFRLPGGGHIAVYQPARPTAIE